jgi:hypothetical protein
MIINDEDGKTLTIRINYSEEPGKNYRGDDVLFIKHEIEAVHDLENGEYVRLYNDIGLDPGYESFENVERHDLMNGLQMKLFNRKDEDIASFTLGLDVICLSDTNQKYEFNQNGVVCGRRITSSDGKTLVSISGDPIPPKATIDSFDLEAEKKKIDNMMALSKTLHPFTKEALEDAKRKLDRKARYVQDVRDYYDVDMKQAQKAIQIRGYLTDQLQNNIIDSVGLDAVARDFGEKTKPKGFTN